MHLRSKHIEKLNCMQIVSSFSFCLQVMKLLELLSGTKSVGRVAKQFGFEVTPLDRDLGADIQCKKQYPAC